MAPCCARHDNRETTDPTAPMEKGVGGPGVRGQTAAMDLHLLHSVMMVLQVRHEECFLQPDNFRDSIRRMSRRTTFSVKQKAWPSNTNNVCLAAQANLSCGAAEILGARQGWFTIGFPEPRCHSHVLPFAAEQHSRGHALGAADMAKPAAGKPWQPVCLHQVRHSEVHRK